MIVVIYAGGKNHGYTKEIWIQYVVEMVEIAKNCLAEQFLI